MNGTIDFVANQLRYVFLDLIQTVPGIGKTTAPAIIAEIGTDMSWK
ncbi:MAG: transposase [Methanothrix sp.]